jgi:hypothetical protein
MKHTELSFEAGPVVAFLPNLVKHLGSVQATLFFCQFLYWAGKGDNPHGTFKTIEDIQRETGLTRTEQQTARAKLRALGVLRETRKHLEHRTYYKLDLDALAELVAATQAQEVCARAAMPLEPSEAHTEGLFEQAYEAFPGEKNWRFAADAWQRQNDEGFTDEELLTAVREYINDINREPNPLIRPMDVFLNNEAADWVAYARL